MGIGPVIRAGNASRKSELSARNEGKFRDELLAIRRRGYSITRGEVDKQVVGIAAPVTPPERTLMS